MTAGVQISWKFNILLLRAGTKGFHTLPHGGVLVRNLELEHSLSDDSLRNIHITKQKNPHYHGLELGKVNLNCCKAPDFCACIMHSADIVELLLFALSGSKIENLQLPCWIGVCFLVKNGLESSTSTKVFYKCQVFLNHIFSSPEATTLNFFIFYFLIITFAYLNNIIRLLLLDFSVLGISLAFHHGTGPYVSSHKPYFCIRQYFTWNKIKRSNS